MRVVYVLEDAAHAQFVPPLFRRLAVNASVDLTARELPPMGGAGRTIDGLRRLLRDIRTGVAEQPDAIVVGIDADCSGRGERSRQVVRACQREDYAGLVVVAEPEPHIESWYFADTAAFQRLLRVADLPPAPSVRCRKDDYKYRLREAVRSGGGPAPLGGVEYGPEIVEEMNISHATGRVRSLRRFVDDARACLARYAAQGWESA